MIHQMKIDKDRISLTIHEAIRIMEILSTLEGMRGGAGDLSYDEDFSESFEKDCRDAGLFHEKIFTLINRILYNEKNRG